MSAYGSSNSSTGWPRVPLPSVDWRLIRSGSEAELSQISISGSRPLSTVPLSFSEPSKEAKSSGSGEKKPSVPSSPAALALRATKGTAKPWILARHLELLNLALVYLAARKAPVRFLRHLGYDCAGHDDDDELPFRRLIVEMPPRHGKSELCSRWFPAWYLARNPHHRIILAAYEARFARTWGMKARDVMRDYCSDWASVRPALDNDAANDWGIEVKTRVEREAEEVALEAWRKTDGGMVTAGVGGPITGRGADGLIVDDPVKNAKDAESEAKQSDTDSWWDSTAQTRLEPDGWVLIIQTRWHANDLAGQVLKKQAEEEDLGAGAEDESWYRITLPAIAEEGDVLGREPGEALWPMRYPIEVLLRRRARTSAYVWAALYQQQPSPPGGIIFDRADWQRFRDLPVPIDSPRMLGCVIVDTATDDDERLDPAGVMTMHRHEFDLYITRWTSVQMRFGTLIDTIGDHVAATQTGEGMGYPVLVEDVPWARPTIHSMEDAGYSVLRQKPEGSKLARALSVQHLVEGHHVYLPEPGSRYYGEWVGRFIEQLASFPTPGVHDEGVDNLTAGLIRLGIMADMRQDSYNRGHAVNTKRTRPKPMDLSILDPDGEKAESLRRRPLERRGPSSAGGAL
jgi:phage terminase large subunit-like protein